MTILLGAFPAWAVSTADQQRCIGALNRDGDRVAAAQAKESLACLKLAGKGELVTTAETCLTADANLKVAAKKGKTSADDTKFCAIPPPFGHAGADRVNAVAQQGELNLIADVFGSAPDLAWVACADSLERCKCQSEVLKGVEKTAKAQRRQFVRCKKAHLPIASAAADLARCVDNLATSDSIAAARASGGKIDKIVAELGAAITRRCDAPAVIDALFPGTCNGQAGTGLRDCLADRSSCRVCQTFNDMDELAVDCDVFDDGTANGSCGGSVYSPTATPIATETPTLAASPTDTPAELPSSTPTESATPAPTDTPEPMSTPTPTATTVMEMLTINFPDSGSGRVTDVANGISCTTTCTVGVPQGTVVHLAVDANGATWSKIAGFYKWTGACSGSGDCVLPVESSTTVDAWISPEDLRIVLADGPFAGTAPPDYTHSRDAVLRLRALAGAREVTRLVEWSTSPNELRLVPPGYMVTVAENPAGYFIGFAAQIWDIFDVYVIIANNLLTPTMAGASAAFVVYLSGDTVSLDLVFPTCSSGSYGSTGACYTHLGATRGVGVCQDGVATCGPEPQTCYESLCFGSWSACVGEVLPSAEICGNGLDENCNSLIDDGCP